MKALTIRSPWAFAIAEKFKTVECRTQRTNYRGPVLIHAGKALERHVDLAGYSQDAADRLAALGGRGAFYDELRDLPAGALDAPPASLALSAVIATAELTGCHEKNGCCAPWGKFALWHWELSNVVQLTAPVGATGRLGLWKPDANLVGRVAARTPAPEAAS